MDNLTALLILGFWAAIIVLVYKVTHPKQKPDIYTEYDMMSTHEKIDDLFKVKESLSSVEQLITDLETLDPRVHGMNLYIKWLGSDEKYHEQPLYCDGVNLNTETMLDIAERLRLELRVEESQKIAMLYRSTGYDFSYMANENETKTGAGECMEGEW